MAHEWAEDDGDIPCGVQKLGLSEPVSGRKYVMYHGTTRQNAKAIVRSGFRQSTGGMLGRGVYLSRDLEKAKRYPIGHPEHDRVVVKVTVDVGRVIAINSQSHPRRTTWHDHGYDTAWVPPNCGMVSSGLEEDCIWDPKRIQILSTIEPKAAPGGRGARRNGVSLNELLDEMVDFDDYLDDPGSHRELRSVLPRFRNPTYEEFLNANMAVSLQKVCCMRYHQF